jgi:glycosyltransferase involved in cell wall biosynthesis
LPVVTTDVPGAREVVDDGRTGFVVDADDFDGLVDAASKLVNDPRLRADLGAAARARCERDFSIGASARRWDALLTAMMAGRCASST